MYGFFDIAGFILNDCPAVVLDIERRTSDADVLKCRNRMDSTRDDTSKHCAIECNGCGSNDSLD